MHELWITKLCNQLLAGPANAVLQLAGIHAEDASKPWSNYMAMLMLVVVIFLLLPVLVRTGLSMDRPGKLQQIFEVIYQFLADLAHEIIGHGSQKHVAFFVTLFLFVLVCNLVGIIPSLESPTMFAPVPLGIAVFTFLYYNLYGFAEQGLIGYLKHFAGPIWWLAWFMFPLEIISHLVRPVSLTIRLFANMLAGEQVTIGFLSLVPLAVPVAFMGLHVFVSFVQAFIFTVLAIVYVAGAVEHEH
ncbi:MAG: F0F1 ATP synthase subunit A [Bryobacteraceae bacterium]